MKDIRRQVERQTRATSERDATAPEHAFPGAGA
jgi:hypothetical protein